MKIIKGVNANYSIKNTGEELILSILQSQLQDLLDLMKI